MRLALIDDDDRVVASEPTDDLMAVLFGEFERLWARRLQQLMLMHEPEIGVEILH